MTNNLTKLEPLAADRAAWLADVLRSASRNDDSVLALDAEGRVIGITDVEDAEQSHVIGDLDVHA